MRCERAQELFSDYCEGNVQRALLVPLEGHLNECPQCRTEVGELRSVWHMLDTAPVVEPPADLRAVVWQRIDAAQRAKPAKRAPFAWGSLLRPRSLAWAAAAIVLVVLAPVVVRGRFTTAGPGGLYGQSALTVDSPRLSGSTLTLPLVLNVASPREVSVTIQDAQSKTVGGPVQIRVEGNHRTDVAVPLQPGAKPARAHVTWNENGAIQSETVPLSLP